MPPITGEWEKALKEEFSKEYYINLYKKLLDEYRNHTVFPPKQDLFNAYHFTPLENVKVVILGQDPYHDVLTVRAHSPQSHQGIGWEKFTDATIKILNEQNRPIVFMLWGKSAISKKEILNNPNHLILTAPHPSPLSAYRGFFDCGHFKKANDFLRENGLSPIDWQIENVN